MTNTPLWWGLLTVPEAVPCVWAGGTRELNSLYSAHLYCELATARKINVYLKKITVREILYLGEKINLNVVLLCLCGPLIFFACVSGPSFLPPIPGSLEGCIRSSLANWFGIIMKPNKCELNSLKTLDEKCEVESNAILLLEWGNYESNVLRSPPHCMTLEAVKWVWAPPGPKSWPRGTCNQIETLVQLCLHPRSPCANQII